MSKHSAEKWSVGSESNTRHMIFAENGDVIAAIAGSGNWSVCEEDAARMVEDHNALAGIPDPAKALEKANEALEKSWLYLFNGGTLEERQRALEMVEEALAVLGKKPTP